MRRSGTVFAPKKLFAARLTAGALCAVLFLFSPWSLVAEARRLVLIHTNDIHGFIEERDCPEGRGSIGGFARLAGYVEARKRSLLGRAKVMLVDAGDIFQGTPVSSFEKGKCMIELFNLIHYDIVTLGNHDFDFGLDALCRRLEESRFLWVSSNVRSSRLSPWLREYVTMRLGDAEVAFLGVTTPLTKVLTLPERVEGVEFMDPLRVLPPLVERLRREGADCIVLVSHMGVSDDERLARLVDGLDVIVGGHSHTLIEGGRRVGRTLVVQAASYCGYVGEVELEIRDGQGVVASEARTVRLDSSVPVDPDVAARVGRYVSRLERKLSVRVGEVAKRLYKGFRGYDSAAGYVLADAYRFVTGADIGLMNIGGVRISLEPGPVTLKRLYVLAPFRNTIVTFKLTGAELKELIESFIEKGKWVPVPSDKYERARKEFPGIRKGLIPERGTGFLVGAGLRYCFDPRSAPGGRLKWIETDYGRLDPHREYVVAVNNFIASGGDGFDFFKERRPLRRYSITDVEALRKYFEKRSPVWGPPCPSVVNESF